MQKLIKYNSFCCTKTITGSSLCYFYQKVNIEIVMSDNGKHATYKYCYMNCPYMALAVTNTANDYNCSKLNVMY